MLPDIANLELDANDGQVITKVGKSFLFDFDAGDFVLKDGRLVKVGDIEALKVWVAKVIKTEKFRFKIYEDIEYGITLEDLSGRTLPKQFVESELKREIKTALEKHPMIESISNFIIEQEGSRLKTQFKVNFINGSFTQEVGI